MLTWQYRFERGLVDPFPTVQHEVDGKTVILIFDVKGATVPLRFQVSSPLVSGSWLSCGLQIDFQCRASLGLKTTRLLGSD